jgi:phenylalanyl-tRNA synthetase beta chain
MERSDGKMVSLVLRKKVLAGLLHERISDARLAELLPKVKCGVEGITEDEVAIEVTGDRPDLLSSEGVARALKGIMAKDLGLPRMPVRNGLALMSVDASVAEVRPYATAAYIRGIPQLHDDDIAELMQIQEKLHLTHGRRRRKVAIGIHDASRIRPPFTYKAVKPKSVSFVPLGKENEMDLDEILRKHEKGVEYAWIFKGADKYPVILDGRGSVVSFPPIINGRLTEVTENTGDLFIEITGSDFDACNQALNILCQNYADRKAAVESVTVRYADRTAVTPETKPQPLTIGLTEANKLLGTSLHGIEAIAALKRCRLDARVEGDFIACEIPRYRTDFLHPVDLVEEIALGLGFDSLEPTLPSIFTQGKESSLMNLRNSLRDAMLGAGYLELNTPATVGKEMLSKAHSRAGKAPVEIRNPVSGEYTHVRSELMPSLLEVLSKNTHVDYPQKVFEVGEAVERNAESETGTATIVSLCALSCHAEADFSEAASTLAQVLNAMKKKFLLKEPSKKEHRFIEGRCADVMVEGEASGAVGEVSPEVLVNFEVSMPCAGFEVKAAEIK